MIFGPPSWRLEEYTSRPITAVNINTKHGSNND
jgi:hypothetical protein